VSVSRLIVTGTLDKVPKLKLLVAHAGACMPTLIGRLDSCVEHDSVMCDKLLHKPSDYLKRLYFDNIAYSQPSLDALIGHVGSDRIMFGTDNPFFPPLNAKDVTKAVWPSTMKVYETMKHLPEDKIQDICGRNAQRILNV
jgi:predicted TIM-barrel fold metal-dependent hydrolase